MAQVARHDDSVAQNVLYGRTLHAALEAFL